MVAHTSPIGRARKGSLFYAPTWQSIRVNFFFCRWLHFGVFAGVLIALWERWILVVQTTWLVELKPSCENYTLIRQTFPTSRRKKGLIFFWCQSSWLHFGFFAGCGANDCSQLFVCKAVILLVNTQIHNFTKDHCRTVPSDGVFCVFVVFRTSRKWNLFTSFSATKRDLLTQQTPKKTSNERFDSSQNASLSTT